MKDLTFTDLREANIARQAYWGGSDNWTLADWPYLDLLAKAAGLDLANCVSRAFNEKSEKLNMPIRLAPHHDQ